MKLLIFNCKPLFFARSNLLPLIVSNTPETPAVNSEAARKWLLRISSLGSLILVRFPPRACHLYTPRSRKIGSKHLSCTAQRCNHAYMP